MRHRRTVVTALVAGLTLPALASADIGPHSTYYAQRSQTDGRHNNITMVLQRVTHKAEISATERCLGTFTVSGTGPGPVAGTYYDSFDLYPVKVSHGKISFRGNVKVFGNSSTPRTQKMHLSAKLTTKQATGTMTFPGTHCGTIRFTAPARGSTR